MLPNLIIIGAQKCGTTSLHYYLDQHPEIFMSRQKELNFFNEEIAWDKGVEWYKAQFYGDEKIHGESSPNYTRYPFRKSVAEKMHAIVPDCRLIYMVRDPIDRMISHYLDRVKGNREKRDVDTALSDFDNEVYVCVSQYYRQLSRFLKYYDMDNILVLSAERLKKNRMEVLKETFVFLNVDASVRSENFQEMKNVSDEKPKRKKPKKWIRYFLDNDIVHPKLRPEFAKFLPAGLTKAINRRVQSGEEVQRPQVSQETHERIADYLREDIRKLREVTGKDFIEWSI